MNSKLPPLPVWQARSFYAQLLLALSVLANFLGIDLMSALAEIGLGESPESVVETGISAWQAVAPLLFGLWAWVERRAPNYRLVFWKGPDIDLVGFLAAGAVAAALVLPAGAARAQQAGPRCGPAAVVAATLRDRYGEAPVWSGQSGAVTLVLYLNPQGTTWTLVARGATGETCLLGAGQGWTSEDPDAAPGQAG